MFFLLRRIGGGGGGSFVCDIFFKGERERLLMGKSTCKETKSPTRVSDNCSGASLSTHEGFIMSRMEWIKEELEVDGTSSASEQ